MSNPPDPIKLSQKQVPPLIKRLKALPADAELLLDRRGQTLYRFQEAGQDLVAKCYQLKKFSSRLVAFLGHSRAARSYRSAKRLLSAGIRTPQPLFTLKSSGLLPSSMTLVTAWQCGIQLPDYLRKHSEGQDRLVEQIAALSSAFCRNRLSHGDFHAKNVLVDEGGTIAIIDLDGVRSHFFSHRLRRRYDRDRTRMIHSLREFPEFAQALDNALPPAT